MPHRASQSLPEAQSDLIAATKGSSDSSRSHHRHRHRRHSRERNKCRLLGFTYCPTGFQVTGASFDRLPTFFASGVGSVFTVNVSPFNITVPADPVSGVSTTTSVVIQIPVPHDVVLNTLAPAAVQVDTTGISAALPDLIPSVTLSPQLITLTLSPGPNASVPGIIDAGSYTVFIQITAEIFPECRRLCSPRRCSPQRCESRRPCSPRGCDTCRG